MMKKNLVFALSLMLLAVFAVGCSMGGDDNVTVSPTVAANPTVETNDGNVTDDATTDEANDMASDTLMDDVDETIDTEASTEPAETNAN